MNTKLVKKYNTNDLFSSMVDGCNGTAVKFFDVTIPDERDWQDNGAIFFSFAPWIMALILIVTTIVTRRVLLVFACLYGGFCVIVNEAIIKQAVSQARPYGTCLSTKGMPSSHSLLSIGYTTWISLESLFHYRDVVIWKKCVVWFVFAVLLVPVPASRVRLHDHSELQVGMGSLEGIILAFLYFALLHFWLANKVRVWMAETPRCKEDNATFLKLVYDYGLEVPPPQETASVEAPPISS